jgi:hypothetical protein
VSRSLGEGSSICGAPFLIRRDSSISVTLFLDAIMYDVAIMSVVMRIMTIVQILLEEKAAGNTLLHTC